MSWCQIVFRTPTRSPGLRSLCNAFGGEYPTSFLGDLRPTFLFLIRWFLIRLSNQSRAVAPPVWNLTFSGFLAASATISLMLDNGSRITESPGRVKYTKDQRVKLPCSRGGGLDTYHGVSKIAQSLSDANLHYTMKVGLEHPSAEDCHCIACKSIFSNRVKVITGIAEPRLQIAWPGIGWSGSR